MALPALLVKIGADTQGLDNALGKAKRGFAGLAKAAAASGVLVAGAFTAMAVQGLRVVDANAKLARSMDGTINGLRAVQIAASYAGVSVGEANTALQQLNRELVSAQEEGTPAYEALRKLGFAASDLTDLDADDRMAAIADRMKALGISSGEAADILRDLGVRSRNMSLLLLQGGDAIRSAREEVSAFGLELTDVQTGAIEAANDSIARMSLVFEGLRGRLAAELAPALKTVADRFNTIAQSDSVQAAIERLAEAFGRLSEIILSEDFMGVAISGLEGLVNISASVADGMVTVSENIEVVTLALSGLAIAVAYASGPIGVLVGALALALGGIAAWRKKISEVEEPTTEAQAAIDALNISLGIVPGSAEAAGKSAIDLANDNYELAESAMAAAEAELAKSRAQIAAKAVPGGVRGPSRARLYEAETEALERLTQAEAALAVARARLDSTTEKEVTGSDYGTTTIPSLGEPGSAGAGGTRPRSREDAAYDEFFGPADVLPAGLGSSDQLAAELEQRLLTLTEGLATESELLAEWYATGQETLADAREKGLLTEAEYKTQLERLEEEHQDKLLNIKERSADADLRMRKAYQSAALSLMGAFAKENKAIAVAEAVVSGYSAAVAAWDKGMKVGGPPVAAAFTAASLAQTAGLISSMKGSDAGGGGGGAGAASGNTAEAAAPVPRRVAEYRVEGTNVRGLQELADDINEMQRQGYVIEIVGR